MRITYTKEELLRIRELPLSKLFIKLPEIPYLTIPGPLPLSHFKKRKNYYHQKISVTVEPIAITKLPSDKVKARGIFNKITKTNFNKLSQEFKKEIEGFDQQQKRELYKFISDKIIYEYNFIELYCNLLKIGINFKDLKDFFRIFKNFIETKNQTCKQEKSIGKFIAISYNKKLLQNFDLYEYISIYKFSISFLTEIASQVKNVYIKNEINTNLKEILSKIQKGEHVEISKDKLNQEKFKIMDHLDKNKKIKSIEIQKETNSTEYISAFKEFITLCSVINGKSEINIAYKELEYYLSKFKIREFVKIISESVFEQNEKEQILTRELINKLIIEKRLTKKEKFEIKSSFDINELQVDIPKIKDIINLIFN